MEQRLIDANALKESVHAHDYVLKDCLNSTDKGMFTVGIMQAIDAQPTIDTEPRWIPCSERLPEEDGDYFVFDSEEYYGVDAYYTHNGTEEYGICLAYKGWQSYHHVEYWMQIPKLPYEVEDEKTN